jgi:uncharacterized protein
MNSNQQQKNKIKNTFVHKISQYIFSVSYYGYEWWFSTSTGGIIRLEPATALALKNSHNQEYADVIPPNEIQILIEAGFLVNPSFNETKYAQSLIDKAKTNVDILAVTIAPTLGCNFSCSYCFESKTNDFKTGQIWNEEIRQNVFAYIVSNLKGRRGLSLRWFGGEPLLALDDIHTLGMKLKTVCDYAGLGFNSYVQTNGYKLTSEACTTLVEAGITGIHISLDGARDRHNHIRYATDNKNTFDTILSNLKNALTIFEPVQVRINTTKAVVPLFDELLDSLATIDPERKLSIYTSPVYRHFNGTESPDKAAVGFSSVAESAEAELVFIKKACERGYEFDWNFLDPRILACSAIKADGIMIGPRGDIVKCDHDYGIPELAMGDVRSGITNLDRFAEWLAVHPRNNPFCSKCVLLPTCGGYCESIRRKIQEPEEACPPKKFNYQGRAELGLIHSDWFNLPPANVLLVRPPRRQWPSRVESIKLEILNSECSQ